MNLSLRIQLSIWFSLAVFVIVVSTTLVAQQVTLWNIERSLDDALQKRANMIAAIISSDITTDEANYAYTFSDLSQQEFPFVPLFLRLISPTGKVIIEFGSVSDPIIRNLDALLYASDINKGRFDSIQISGIEPLRTYTISVFHPRTEKHLATVQVLETFGQVGEARDRLWRSGIIVALAGGALAIATGLILIQRGFRPMNKILETINEVDYAHLKTSIRKETRPAELEQLANSLTAMWQRLDIAVSERQRTIGSVSHDLRTPLTALQGQIEVLLLQPSLSTEVRDSLERILKETRRLIRMVKNVLLTTQLESKPSIVVEEVNLKELIDEVIGDMWVLAEGIEFNVVAPVDIIVHGDRDLLKQMMMNITDNSIKFTPQGGEIKVRLNSENGWSILEISDTGRGIPEEQLPHIMEAFYQSETSQRFAGEGARLGLSIVKQIVELHGGQVTIQSKQIIGTKVEVRLPEKCV